MRLIVCEYCEEVFEYHGNRQVVKFCQDKPCNQRYHKAKYKLDGRSSSERSERLRLRDEYEESIVIDPKWLTRGTISTKVEYNLE